jgi:hypothetical protein
MLTDRDIQVLFAICEYYVLNRPQIQHLCFPTDKTGRVTRRRIQALVSSDLLNRHKAQVIYPNSSPAGSIYYPSQKGREFLYEHTGDQKFLTVPTQCPQPHHILHWLAVTDTHIKLAEAIQRQKAVELQGWINEWDTVNKDELKTSKQYRLHTVLKQNPRLICAPDSAFMLKTTFDGSDFAKVFYLEQDRGTSGVRQVAARKIKGFAELAAQYGHHAHFPATNVETFTVVCIAHNQRRRDALRRAFDGLTGSNLWKFCSADQLNNESFLFEPVWYATTGDAVPLVKQQVAS